MAGSQQPVVVAAAAVPLGIAAALCIPLLLVANYQRRNRAHNKPKQLDDDNRLNCCVGRAPSIIAGAGAGMTAGAMTTAAADRRAPEDEHVFSLYGGHGGDDDDESVGADAEASSPPMELSSSVLVLLESFDVDPVRGKPHILLYGGTNQTAVSCTM